MAEICTSILRGARRSLLVRCGLRVKCSKLFNRNPLNGLLQLKLNSLQKHISTMVRNTGIYLTKAGTIMSFCRGYWIRHTDDGWFFELGATSRPDQPLVTSIIYPSETQCREAVIAFKNHIRAKSITSCKSEYVVRHKDGIRLAFEYLDINHQQIACRKKTVLASSNGYSRCIKRINDYIDDYTSHELTNR